MNNLKTLFLALIFAILLTAYSTATAQEEVVAATWQKRLSRNLNNGAKYVRDILKISGELEIIFGKNY